MDRTLTTREAPLNTVHMMWLKSAPTDVPSSNFSSLDTVGWEGVLARGWLCMSVCVDRTRTTREAPFNTVHMMRLESAATDVPSSHYIHIFGHQRGILAGGLLRVSVCYLHYARRPVEHGTHDAVKINRNRRAVRELELFGHRVV